MTHDELLELLDGRSQIDGVEYHEARALAALRGVVELCDVWEAKGSYCVPINNVIRAIEKELQ